MIIHYFHLVRASQVSIHIITFVLSEISYESHDTEAFLVVLRKVLWLAESYLPQENH